MSDVSDLLNRTLRGARVPAPVPPYLPASMPAPQNSRLVDPGAFGPNPGALGARVHVPAGLARGAPLVVVLHGCTQTAAGYDHGAGWSRLADAHGFALLFPEQQRQNNANLCFNWFEPGDTRRDGGEAASIAAMVRHVIAVYGCDPARVFVNGLSAGGAMTAVMLATWPDVFAGGAIVAGLPFAGVANVQGALAAMRTPTPESAAALAARVHAASPHRGPWPRVSVWHGSADATVASGNADASARQWTAVHGLAAKPDRVAEVGVHTRRVWLGPDGRAAIEDWRIAGMGHGTPLAADGCGTAGPFMLDAGVSSTRHIAAFWGIAPQPGSVPARPDPGISPSHGPDRRSATLASLAGKFATRRT